MQKRILTSLLVCWIALQHVVSIIRASSDLKKTMCWKIQISKGQDKSGWSGSEVSVALHIFFRKLNWRMLVSREISHERQKNIPFCRSYQIAYCPDLQPSVIKGSCEFFQPVGFICCRLSGITLYKYPQSLVVLSADGTHPAASRPAFSPTGFTVKAPGWCFGAARPVKNKRVRGRHLLIEYKRTKRSAMAIKYKSEKWMDE